MNQDNECGNSAREKKFQHTRDEPYTIHDAATKKQNKKNTQRQNARA